MISRLSFFLELSFSFSPQTQLFRRAPKALRFLIESASNSECSNIERRPYVKKKEFYEVIKFIEHGSKCRLTMDYVEGELLINRLLQGGIPKKQEMFQWFLSLGEQLEQYHRCSKAKCYYYLNPYSVLITNEGKVMLLDLAAESNGFVLKNLQKRSMRQHFIKTELHSWEDPKLSKDLYGLGKTIQFVLAHANVEPRLTAQEESRFVKVISKCLGENQKKYYENLKQVQKELPHCKKENTNNVPSSRNRKIMVAAIVILTILFVSKVVLPSLPEATDAMVARVESESVDELLDREGSSEVDSPSRLEINLESEMNSGKEMGPESEMDLALDGSPGLKVDSETALDVEAEESSGLGNSSFAKQDLFVIMESLVSEWEDGIDANNLLERKAKREICEQLELKIVRYLATLYEEEYKMSEAIRAYQRLSQLETEEERLVFANQRKVALEAEQELFEQALRKNSGEVISSDISAGETTPEQGAIVED